MSQLLDEADVNVYWQLYRAGLSKKLEAFRASKIDFKHGLFKTRHRKCNQAKSRVRSTEGFKHWA